MSTRCQVIIKDSYSEVWFYRHSDGYPEAVIPSLEKFLSWVKEGKIRADAMQASGWLVILGHNEYQVSDEPGNDPVFDWKVGAYEPCTPEEHEDIEYLYTVDLEKKEITYKET
jgi:hypothetical protein